MFRFFVALACGLAAVSSAWYFADGDMVLGVVTAVATVVWFSLMVLDIRRTKTDVAFNREPGGFEFSVTSTPRHSQR